jgi:hypothetical protein
VKWSSDHINDNGPLSAFWELAPTPPAEPCGGLYDLPIEDRQWPSMSMQLHELECGSQKLSEGE